MEPTEHHTSTPVSGSEDLDTRHIFPFLKLSGELRNLIYEYAAATAPTVRVFEDRTVLPPLACVCRKICSEMSGKHEEEVILIPRTDIEAYCTNIGFASLFKWLDENDRRLEGHAKFVRTLHIHLDLISVNSASPIERFQDQCSTSPSATQKRVDRAFKALGLCCMMRWAQNGDDELKTLESTLPKFNLFKQSSDDNRTRRRVQTRSGNGYLVSCNAQTLHAHQPSEVEPTLSKAYFCHLCAYIGYLVNELQPESKLALWGPAARRFHWVVKEAIKDSCKDWHGREMSSCDEGQPTALDLSLANLHSTTTNPATLELGSKRTASASLEERESKRLDDRRRPGMSQDFVLPIIPKTDKVEEELRAVIKKMGRLRLTDK